MSSECETADTGGKGRSLAKSTSSHRSAHTKKDHVKTQAQRHVYYPRSSDIITCHHISSHCTHSYPFMTNYIDLLYFFFVCLKIVYPQTHWLIIMFIHFPASMAPFLDTPTFCRCLQPRGLRRLDGQRRDFRILPACDGRSTMAR